MNKRSYRSLFALLTSLAHPKSNSGTLDLIKNPTACENEIPKALNTLNCVELNVIFSL